LARRVRDKGDVAFVSMPSPLLQALAGVYLKWRHGTPLVYWVQDIWPESAVYTLGLRNPLIVRPLTWVCGWLYRRADLILVQSAAFPKMIERFGVPAARIRVFPNTAPEAYVPLTPDPDSRIGQMIPRGRFTLMFAGNIGESQDFDTYLAAAQRLRETGCDVAWVIVGSGRDQARVMAEVARRGLQDVFHFLGRHPESDMPEFFAHADAMLVGLKDNPIFSLTVPYKVQCYMACGRPIVASLSGEGARVIAEAGAGIVAPAQSPDALADAIRRMVEATPHQRAAMADAARSYFLETYATDMVYGDLERWLAETAGMSTAGER
jgi:glycosyltransferase involved in cell wall biosynthesis